MMFSSKFHVQCSRLGAKISTRLLATSLVLWLCAGILYPVKAQDLRVKAEAEGNLMMYATFTAADSKTLLDGFKQVYPKIATWPDISARRRPPIAAPQSVGDHIRGREIAQPHSDVEAPDRRNPIGSERIVFEDQAQLDVWITG